MRMLLKVTIPADKGNETLKDGSLQQTFDKVAKDLKPEASYFLPLDGQRTALFFFDMAAVSDLVPAVEPMWMAFDADVELVPVMNLDDLMAGMKKAFG